MGKVKKHLVIHILAFPPDQVSTAYLYGDIVQEFLSNGYKVSVFTTTPHYNYTSNFSSVSKFSFFWRKTNYYGAEVFHFPHVSSKNLLIKGLNILLFHISFFLRVIFLKNIDVILTPSPPISLGFLSGLVSRIKGAKSVYNVQEIYPDVLINHLGIKNKIILSLLRKIEKWTYLLNDKVVAIDDHFAMKIKDRLAVDKLSVIPNFVDADLYAPYMGGFRDEFSFPGKYLVGYVGNLGKVQDWDCVLSAAKILVGYSEIHFLFVGGGAEFSRLENIGKLNSNITVLPYQNRANIPELNQRINLHFISMAESSDYDGLPSKVLTILSSGKKILAATGKDSPLALFLNKSGNSTLVDRGDAQSFANAILSIMKQTINIDEQKRVRDYIVDNYSKPVICGQYISLVDSLL